MRVLITQLYVAYLDTPVKSQEFFKQLWENHYAFLPEVIYFSNDLRSAVFDLDETQSSQVANAPAFIVNRRKVIYVHSICVVYTDANTV